jgi:hypothetical protein
MVESNDMARQAQLRRLIKLYEKGLLLKEDFQAALIGIGMDPAIVFDQLQ